MRFVAQLAAVAALGLLARPAVAGAQSLPASSLVAPGERVRVTAPAGVSFIGTLLPSSDDTVRVLLANGSGVALPAAHVTQLERSTGIQRHRMRGATTGLIGGAAFGALVGSATYIPAPCDPSNNVDTFCNVTAKSSSRALAIAVGALVGGAGGAFAGSLIGGSPRETWERVPLRGDEKRVGLSSRGIGLRIAM